nr:MAG TPA_asm: hypothetical protein [Caudoviricetes sp.]
MTLKEAQNIIGLRDDELNCLSVKGIDDLIQIEEQRVRYNRCSTDKKLILEEKIAALKTLREYSR